MNNDMFNFGVDPNKKPTSSNDAESTTVSTPEVAIQNNETVTEEVIEPTVVEETIEINEDETIETTPTTIETPQTEDVSIEKTSVNEDVPKNIEDPRDVLIKNMMDQMEAMTSAIKSMKDKGNKNGKETYKF